MASSRTLSSVTNRVWDSVLKVWALPRVSPQALTHKSFHLDPFFSGVRA
jgi:hypothetical protein